MKHTKYKISILSDLKGTSAAELKSTISFAKMINGEIDFFHVKNSTDIVNKESQLSAMRSINDTYKATENKMRKLITTISNDYDMNINYSFAFGNIKNEIEAYLKDKKPDIIVLGKKKNNPFKLIGNNVTEFILKKHKGPILIADYENSLKPNMDLSLGLFNCNNTLNFNFASELINHTKKPVKSFQIGGENETKIKDLKTVDYVFEQSNNTSETLKKYLTENNINILCLDRVNESKGNNKALNTNIKDISNNLNVTLLITGKTQLN